MKTILFVPKSKTSIEAFIYLANRIRLKHESIKIIIYNSSAVYYDDSCISPNIEFIQNIKTSKKILPTTRFFNKLYSLICNISFYYYHAYWSFCRIYSIYDKEAKIIMDNIKPDIIVTNSDRDDLIGNFFLKYADAIPCVVIPIGLLGDPKNDALRREEINYKQFVVRGTNGRNNKILKKYPRQGYKLDDRAVLFYNAPRIMAMAKYDILSDCLWAEGGYKNTNLVCVSSKLDEKTVHDFVDVKTLITGTVEEFGIVEKAEEREYIRENLKNKYNFFGEICVFSVPNYYELGMCSREIQMGNVERIIEALGKHFDKVLISLHPRVKTDDYIYLADKYDVSIIDEKLRDIIVAADYFIASTDSSTMRWGIISGSKCIPIEFNDWIGGGLSKIIDGYMLNIHEIERKSLDYKKKYPFLDIDKNDIVDIAEMLVEIMSSKDLTKM